MTGAVLMGLGLVAREAGGITVCVDPRLELLSVIQTIGGYDGVYGLLTKLDFGYKARIKERFAGFADHPAVRMFDRMSTDLSNGFPPFSFSAPPEAFLYLKPDFGLAAEVFDNTFLVGRADGADSLKAFMAMMAVFYRESRFAGFFAENEGFYRRIVDETAAKVAAKPYVEELERYYGTSQAGYRLDLVPMFHTGGFGPSISLGGGRQQIHSIMGPRELSEGLPDFGSSEYFTRILRHEFSHSFVNPLTLKYRELVAMRSHISPLLDGGRKSGCYGDWEEAVNEYTIRAVTTRMAFADSEEDGRKALEFEESKGLGYIRPLMDTLALYEARRDIYPDFDSFYPELMKGFESFERIVRTEKQTRQHQ